MAWRNLLFLMPLLALRPVAAMAQAQAATVLSIGDGDTLRVQDRGRTITVRLACIDAPEMAQSPWGQQARQQLQLLAPVGAAIALHSKAIDRYGRQVAEVSLGGRNINQALVANGAAFVYWQYISSCDRQTYGRLETDARMKGLGVWSTPGGITRPWDLRRGHRRASTTDHTEAGTIRRYRCREIRSHSRAQELLRSSVREQEPSKASRRAKAAYLEVEGRPGSRPDPRPPTESGQGSPEPVRTAEVCPKCQQQQSPRWRCANAIP